MSGELRFDGKVAIVTGAGGNPGLGRSYAMLLAARGAKVVVNDLGVGPDGRGVRRANAEIVAQEIVDAGGEAVADTNSVAERESAAAVIARAVDTWGKVDLVINNAGVSYLTRFDELSPADVERVVNVHLLGTIWMCRAAWPHMKEAGGGRIVNVTSGSMLGNPMSAVYGAAKGGIFALTRSLAIEGTEHAIVVNSVMPAAFTVATDHFTEDGEWKQQMAAQGPDDVAAVAVYLGHESCPLNGGCLAVRNGRVWETVLAETRGYEAPAVTLEELRNELERIQDRDGLIETTLSLSVGRRSYVAKPYQPA